MGYFFINTKIFVYCLKPLKGSKNRSVIRQIEKNLSDNPNIFYSIFEGVALKLDDYHFNGRTCHFKGRVHLKESISIEEHPISSLYFQASIQAIEKELEIPSILVYDSPEVEKLNRNVFVENVELGRTEIIQSENKVHIALDISQVEPPINCQFRYVTVKLREGEKNYILRGFRRC